MNHLDLDGLEATTVGLLNNVARMKEWGTQVDIAQLGQFADGILGLLLVLDRIKEARVGKGSDE